MPDGSVQVPGGVLSISNVADPGFQRAILGGATSTQSLVQSVPNPIVLRPRIGALIHEFRETTVVDSRRPAEL